MSAADHHQSSREETADGEMTAGTGAKQAAKQFCKALMADDFIMYEVADEMPDVYEKLVKFGDFCKKDFKTEYEKCTEILNIICEDEAYVKCLEKTNPSLHEKIRCHHGYSSEHSRINGAHHQQNLQKQEEMTKTKAEIATRLLANDEIMHDLLEEMPGLFEKFKKFGDLVRNNKCEQTADGEDGRVHTYL